MNESVLNQGNHKNRQDVVHRLYSEDLPLHCPPDNTELWSQHPRVFLPIAPGQTALCPYCGNQFFLPKGDT
ncbi:MAG: zinc-finger domain-containing protein [Proteobacteria bacterium]|nr:zinc-finger domain-containing protein [Pseudomonadota bacterium]MDB4826614.1 zinc-finger domain-containing protein [Gammaproteobacteria bacterium]MBT4108450.1 zinc-finger domain-containing protein [Pseudomonadota bacterium]MBT4357934.1 zinc-finger domain-containing protein [Pseudomonadota bacterium]MBT4987625.1 zinc-finger domain-containing protein [Pseudomonadota bacterium]